MEQIILIHGALGNASELHKIGTHLSSCFKVIYYEIPGHGERSHELDEFTLEISTKDFISFLKQTGPSYIFGFSLGGYLALTAAQKDASNIKGIVTLGTKFNWNPEVAVKETQKLALDFLKEKVEGFYSYLKGLHKDHLSILVKHTQEFMIALGAYPTISAKSVGKIEIPVRLIRGGKDRMVSKEETQAIASALKKGGYFEIPSFIHPVGFLNPKVVAKAIDVQLQSMNYQKLATKYGSIAFQKIGELNPSAPTLLFLHEALGSIRQWKDFPAKLCKSLNTDGVIIELPGYGFSDPAPQERKANYLHHFGQEVIPEIIIQLKLSKKILLVGHSDGGTNALLTAKRLPNIVDGVVTMAAHIINEKKTRAGIPPAIEAFESGKMSGLEVYHGNKTETLFYNWARTWLSEEFKNWSIDTEIKNLTVPGLIIQGYNDQYGTPKQVSKIATCFDASVATKLIENCGHAPHLEQSESVINLIKKWKTNLS